MNGERLKAIEADISLRLLFIIMNITALYCALLQIQNTKSSCHFYGTVDTLKFGYMKTRGITEER